MAELCSYSFTPTAQLLAPAAFLEEAKEVLETCWGLNQHVLAAANAAETGTLFFVVRLDGACAGAVAKAPMQGANVAGIITAAGAHAVLQALDKENGEASTIRMVTGPAESARAFASACAAMFGNDVIPGLEAEALVLDNAPVPVNVPGELRKVAARDAALPLLAEWHRQFCEDALGDGDCTITESLQIMSSAADREELFVWTVAGRDVAMVTIGRRKLGLDRCSLNLVFVDRAERKRGYASAAVAALCSEKMQRGERKIALFAHIASRFNTVELYERLGFHRVGRHMGYHVESSYKATAAGA